MLKGKKKVCFFSSGLCVVGRSPIEMLTIIQEFREGARRIEEDFTRKLKDLEDEIIKRDAKEREKVEQERDQLSQELLKVESTEEALSQEEVAAIREKKSAMENRLKGII